MDRYTLAGVGLFTVGLLGYVAGIHITYPGRAFSITAIIVGIALVAIAQRSASRNDI